MENANANTNGNKTLNLHERAILIKPHLPIWSDRIEDQVETDAVIARYNAAKGSAKVVTRLIVKSAHTERQREAGEEHNAYDKLVSHMSAFRSWSYANTLPWNRDGWLILPRLNYEAYMDKWRKAKEEYLRLLDLLAIDWHELVQSSKREMNGLGANVKWPCLEDVLEKFDMSIKPREVPSGDFRVSLGDAELAALREGAEADMRDMAKQVTAEAVKRLYECLDNIKQRLSEKSATSKSGYSTFRDTLIENAREICDVLTRLNVTDNQLLEKYRRETELLAMGEPETIRENVSVRLETIGRADKIMQDMLAAFGKETVSK